MSEEVVKQEQGALSGRWEALQNNVLAVPFEPQRATTGGLYIPDRNQKVMRWSTVLSRGPGAHDFRGEWVEPSTSEGDVVYIMAHGQHKVSVVREGMELEGIMASELDILAKLNAETSELEPMGDLLEIEVLSEEEKSSGGLFMPKAHRHLPNVARVKSRGPGLRTVANTYIPMYINVGDIVLFDPLNTQKVDLEALGRKGHAVLVSASSVLARHTQPTAAEEVVDEA